MNFRFAFCAAIMVVLSIFLSCTIFISQKMKLALILIFAGVFLVLLICFAFSKKKILIHLLAIILIGTIPVVSIYFKSNELNRNSLIIAEKVTFSGKISSIKEDLDNDAIFINLSNVEIIENEEAKNFRGKVYLRVIANGVDTSKLELGRYLTINNAKLDCLALVDGFDSKDRSFLSRGINATSYAFAYNMKIEDKVSLNFRDKVKSKVFEVFNKTDTFFTGVGYAMIFGESSVLDESVYDVFKGSGIAHLLAVSGFHISLIVSFLVFILNKLKANKYLKILIVSFILLIYSYFCSFSVSVIRASIMAILLLYASSRNKEYDKLSALSLALIFILSLAPMQMFNISFIFSFISILSIILLSPVIERFFLKFLNESLSSSISVSLSVCLGLLVFQLYYFGSYPILSLISNIITMPIVGILFIYLLISVLIGSCFGFAVTLINAFGSCMKVVIQFNSWITNNGLFISCGNFGAIALLLSILIMFMLSDFVFIKKKIKLPVAAVMLTALILVIIWAKWTRQKYMCLI